MSTKQRATRSKQSLAALYPKGLRIIARALDVEDTKPDGQPVVTDDSWKVVHMLDGVPRQQVDSNIKGEVVIRVVYETKAIPPDSTPEEKP